ncbi:MAG TPA: nuclear transport factor 2 family protein [Acidimicrobiales bacterium]|nr:nuclear transport factor 2 family protein [Acidimicrobiales bacterium]
MAAADAPGPDALRRLADEMEIRNVVARLAHLADASGPDDLDEYLDLFTADASWEMPGNDRRGRADIQAGARERRLAGQQGPGTGTRHVITTQAVRFEGPDGAVSDSYFLLAADTATAPTIRIVGHYHDLFRRVDGSWKLAQRRITPG